MKKTLKSCVEQSYDENKGKILISATTIILGVILGAVWACLRRHEQSPDCFSNFVSSYRLLGADKSDVLHRAIFANIRTVFFIWISGWFIFLLPLNYTELSAKGFGIGYTVSYIVVQDGIKGFFFALSALLLQNAVLIPTIIVYSVIQFKFALSYYNAKKSAALYKQRIKLIKNNILTFCAVILICLPCSFVDAYITPVLFKAFL